MIMVGEILRPQNATEPNCNARKGPQSRGLMILGNIQRPQSCRLWRIRNKKRPHSGDPLFDFDACSSHSTLLNTWPDMLSIMTLL